MTTASRRTTELGLLVLGTLFVVGAYLLASVPEDSDIPTTVGPFLGVIVGDISQHYARGKVLLRVAGAAIAGSGAWFLAGAAVGGVLALLFAPHSGAQTRHLLKRKARDLRDLAEHVKSLAEEPPK